MYCRPPAWIPVLLGTSQRPPACWTTVRLASRAGSTLPPTCGDAAEVGIQGHRPVGVAAAGRGPAPSGRLDPAGGSLKLFGCGYGRCQGTCCVFSMPLDAASCCVSPSRPQRRTYLQRRYGNPPFRRAAAAMSGATISYHVATQHSCLPSEAIKQAVVRISRLGEPGLVGVTRWGPGLHSARTALTQGSC